jgi:hypothetical protein
LRDWQAAQDNRHTQWLHFSLRLLAYGAKTVEPAQFEDVTKGCPYD